MRYLHHRCSPFLTAEERAHRVIRWLNQQDKWLLVIDNLDNIDVVRGYVPLATLAKHTLITTRNGFYHHIPSEGLFVDVLNLDEAISLLVLRSQLLSAPLSHDESLGTYHSLLSRLRHIFGKSQEIYISFFWVIKISVPNITPDSLKEILWLTIAESNRDAINLPILVPQPPYHIDSIFGKDGLNSDVRDVFADDDRFYKALSNL